MRSRGESAGRALVEAGWRRGRRRFAAYVVHGGAVVAVVAIAVSSTMGVSREVQLGLGDTARVGDYTLTFVGVERESEPHREALVARVEVARGGKSLGELRPRMNQYERQREPVGTPAVRTSLFEDLYLSVMNVDAARGSVGLLAMVNPMVAWIWVSAAVMALGALVALVPSRRTTAVWEPARLPAADAGRAVAEG
jgi:cytochrome c-type biogenesis protein CcmF